MRFPVEPVPTTIVFDHPTPFALARYLIEEVVGEPKDVVVSVAAKNVEEPIAIVGMGCRFPGGVSTPERLWDLVASGTDAISPFPTDRGWELEDAREVALDDLALRSIYIPPPMDIMLTLCMRLEVSGSVVF